MENHLKALLLFSILMSFAGGFYVASILQKQIEVLVGAAIIVAFLSWIGSGTDFIGLIREWYKEKKEEKSIGSLVFGTPIKINRGEITAYFIPVINTRVNTFVKNCKGSLNIDQYSTLHLTWRSNDEFVNDLSLRDHLGIFTTKLIGSRVEIMFRIKQKGYAFDLTKFSNENIQITLVADHGQLPNPLNTTINEIIKNAMEEKSLTL